MIALLARDLKLAVRAGGGFGLALAFFLIVTVLVPFAVGPDTQRLQPIAAGVLWIGALLACLLSLDRMLALDHEDGTLELMATAPLPLEGVILIKAAAHWLTTGLPLTLIAAPLGVLLNLAPPGYAWLVISLGCGTPALSMIGALDLPVAAGRGDPDVGLSRRHGGGGRGDGGGRDGAPGRPGADAGALGRGDRGAGGGGDVAPEGDGRSL